ncbi:ROK family protein [Fundicoccus culcitae]|uniref:ROK family protein n=1 Tax=Fundicoccus culcitae TaxID=2969821 RepID=A0ABY5P995_9LACT|nr:ROK family protein [Fundicoccus culcitae]UUX35030.1 ROK family protein [Fundicoccus culcitae]
MGIGVVDIGGTNLKYGLWEKESLLEIQTIPTPATLDDLFAVLKDIDLQLRKAASEEILGYGFSVPGMVDTRGGIIEGISAVPYIHDFPIRDQLEDLLKVRVTLENDANCACIAELDRGHAKDVNNIAVIVVGTGIGGTVVINNEIVHGVNFAAGEFGLMMVNEENTFSEKGSTGRLVDYYRDLENAEPNADGERIFELAGQGDENAQRSVDRFYKYMSQGVYNLIVMLNPERILIGGAVSKNAIFIRGVQEGVKGLLRKHGVPLLKSDILACKYYNHANLIGAASSFIRQTRLIDLSQKGYII